MYEYHICIIHSSVERLLGSLNFLADVKEVARCRTEEDVEEQCVWLGSREGPVLAFETSHTDFYTSALLSILLTVMRTFYSWNPHQHL